MIRTFTGAGRGAAAVVVVAALAAPLPAVAASAAPVGQPPPAPAGRAVGPVNPVAPALSFGVMTEGNATVVASENEGTMAVGGDLSFGNYQLANNTAGSFVVPGDSRPSALVVGGRVDFAGSVPGTRLQVLSQGYAKVGNLTGTVVRDTDNNGAAVNTRILPTNNYDAFPRVELTVRQAPANVGPTSPINFAAAYESFRSTSVGLAGCANTVVLRTPNGDVLPSPIPPGSNAVVTLTSGVTNVLNLSATDLNNIDTLTFRDQPTPTTPLLINVDTSGVGNTFDWNAPNFSGIGGQQAQYVLINFPTATRLSLTAGARTVEGSIYAPNADFTDLSASNTEGSVITRTLDHRGGEIHYFPFSTTLTCNGGGPASIAVVKSSTTALIGSVGQQVPYSFRVVNTGGVRLTDVTVDDVQTPPSSNANLGPITCPVTALDPGASTTCTATYTVTQADLDHGGVSDTATARGTPAGGGAPVVSDPTDLTIPAEVLTPSISVLKSSTTTTITTAGQQVPYRFAVTNTGGLTLSDVNVTDTQTPPSSNANLGPITCPVTTLAPGASTTCTATYTVTQADLDHGSVSDTATAHGTPPGSTTPVDSEPSELTIAATPVTPDITLVKSSTTTTITAEGQQVEYRFAVTNTGGVTLSDVNVTDVQTPPSSNANLGPITCPVTTLAPGASTTCTATYTVSQADLDIGRVSDTATAHGTPPGSATPIDSDPSDLTIAARPAPPEITVVKSSTTTTITAAGQQVPYRFAVTNTGGVTLSDVNVTDVQTPPSSNTNLGPITCPVTTLAPGASTTCTATYTVSQADIDNGSLGDTATAHGTPVGGETPIDSEPSDLTVPRAPVTAGISVDKTSTTTVVTAPGQRVPYRFVVVNTGGLTLSNVTVTDVQTPPSSNVDLGPITCADTTLAPGASTTCTATYTVTQADLDHGSVSDTATAHGTPAGAQTPIDSDPASLTVPAGDPAVDIEVVKSSDTVAITQVGQKVNYTYRVVNTGGLTLTRVTVNDTLLPPASRDNLTVITCGPDNVPNGTVTLAPGASVECRATYTVSEADFAQASLLDVATATGTPPRGPAVVSGPSTQDIPILHPGIALTKTVTPEVVSRPGEVVTYRYVVTDTGNTTLTGVAVDETAFSGSGRPSAITCDGATLAPGQSLTCTATYAVTEADVQAGRVTNTAVAVGTPPTVPGQDPPAPVRSEPASATVTATRGAAIALEKSADPGEVHKVGQQVRYRFQVTNTGSVPLTGVTVTDTLAPPADPANLGPITCGPGGTPNGAVTLAPGESVTCTATYTVSKADASQRCITDTATATGTPPAGAAPVSPEATLCVRVVIGPGPKPGPWPWHGHGKLPVTGTSFLLPLAVGGAAVLLTGVTLMLLTRRRRIGARHDSV
ncbi:choice-of-anchor A family protein [Micromonospora sp. WMMA1996]|uniref:DUF7507 domain-containing protein n=1 Tax=Micromonospora sp. WMMA1996 TaxID=2039878 RepID=UPI0011454DD8